MNNDQFLRSIHKTFEEVETIVAKKNADYANSSDPFKNFRSSEHVGVPVSRAILVRMMDKLARIANLIDKDPSVITESRKDTIIDIIGYAAILNAWLES